MNETIAAIRILIAEDEPAARMLLVESLNSLGHTVVAEAASCQEAVDYAQQLTPDVVLLDVHLPDASGVQAATQIAAALPHVAVVLFSGDHNVTLSDGEIRDTAAITLLAKPTPPGMLDTALRLAVARARAHRSSSEEASAALRQLENRKLIERAKGILMRRTGTTEQEAYRILQRSSQDKATPMAVLARAVLDSEPGAAARA
jgi:response regulator NasT